MLIMENASRVTEICFRYECRKTTLSVGRDYERNPRRACEFWQSKGVPVEDMKVPNKQMVKAGRGLPIQFRPQLRISTRGHVEFPTWKQRSTIG